LGGNGVDQTSPGADRIGRMKFGGVMVAQGGGNAPLGQSGIARGSGIKTESSGGEQRDGNTCRGQPLHRAQPCNTGTNNDNHGRAASIRSNATAASFVTEESTLI